MLSQTTSARSGYVAPDCFLAGENCPTHSCVVNAGIGNHNGTSLHNDYRQWPITSDVAEKQYCQYLAQLETLIANEEDVVRQVRLRGDIAALVEARTSLWRLLTKRRAW